MLEASALCHYSNNNNSEIIPQRSNTQKQIVDNRHEKYVEKTN